MGWLKYFLSFFVLLLESWLKTWHVKSSDAKILYMYNPRRPTGKSRSRPLKIQVWLRELSWFNLAFRDWHRPFKFLLRALWPTNQSLFVMPIKRTILRSRSRLMLTFYDFRTRPGSNTCVLKRNKTWQVLVVWKQIELDKTCQVPLVQSTCVWSWTRSLL
jgi:hypothetical protein